MAKNNWNYCAPALTGPGAAGAAGAGPGGNFAAVKPCSLTGAEKSQCWWVWGEGLQDMEGDVAFSHPLLSRPAPQGQCFRSRAGVKAGPDPRLTSWRAAVAAVGSFQHRVCLQETPTYTQGRTVECKRYGRGSDLDSFFPSPSLLWDTEHRLLI